MALAAPGLGATKGAWSKAGSDRPRSRSHQLNSLVQLGQRRKDSLESQDSSEVCRVLEGILGTWQLEPRLATEVLSGLAKERMPEVAVQTRHSLVIKFLCVLVSAHVFVLKCLVRNRGA
ncbi:unnamed protein product [Polarella glacialis]|uniref:Uncharacterized protein n=1 Tax=Polarella glacialis TaxID=89957 RepID=A0A813H7V6_POLGL|nr:unnamed protein product [Polarella glacialis]